MHLFASFLFDKWIFSFSNLRHSVNLLYKSLERFLTKLRVNCLSNLAFSPRFCTATTCNYNHRCHGKTCYSWLFPMNVSQSTSITVHEKVALSESQSWHLSLDERKITDSQSDNPDEISDEECDATEWALSLPKTLWDQSFNFTRKSSTENSVNVAVGFGKQFCITNQTLALKNYGERLKRRDEVCRVNTAMKSKSIRYVLLFECGFANFARKIRQRTASKMVHCFSCSRNWQGTYQLQLQWINDCNI